MDFFGWIGQRAAKLRRSRTLPASAPAEERARALHSPSSNAQLPTSYGRKLAPSTKERIRASHQASPNGPRSE